ncbi:hypothetical protein [Roseateles sp. P5_E11]
MNTAQKISGAIFDLLENRTSPPQERMNRVSSDFNVTPVRFARFAAAGAIPVMVLSPAFGSTAARCENDRGGDLAGCGTTRIQGASTL